MDQDRSDEERDDSGEDPPARFQRFEKVLVEGNPGRWYPGTILWRDLTQYYSPYAEYGSGEIPRRWSEWQYAVYVPDLDRCATLKDDRLRGTGEFEAEEAHLGRRHEISFDTGLGEDLTIVEGSYRVPGRFWQVFRFIKGDPRGRPLPVLRHEFSAWPSGITGVEFLVPKPDVLDRDYVLRAFADVFGAGDWVEVRGPDSLLLR